MTKRNERQAAGDTSRDHPADHTGCGQTSALFFGVLSEIIHGSLKVGRGSIAPIRRLCISFAKEPWENRGKKVSPTLGYLPKV